MSVTGAPDNTPGGGPIKVGVAVADIFTGLYAAIGILAALRHRELTGRGDHIDLALLDVQVAVLANQALNYLMTGVSPARLGNAHPTIVPYQALATSDGYFILAVGNDSQFRRFCETAGCLELADDARFANNPARVANREALVPLIEARTRRRPTGRWIADLEAAGVPCGPITERLVLERMLRTASSSAHKNESVWVRWTELRTVFQELSYEVEHRPTELFHLTQHGAGFSSVAEHENVHKILFGSDRFGTVRLVFWPPPLPIPKFEAVGKEIVNRLIILKKRGQVFKRRAIEFFQPKQRGCRSRSISEH